MKIKNLQVIKKYRFAFAQDEDSGRKCISIPVYNGLAEYNEYYEISEDEFALFLSDIEKAKSFVDRCREHQEDNRLMQKPGRLRGGPI